MSYKDLTDYLDKLKYEHHTRIDWSVIDSSLVKAVNHDQLAGLQLADAVASGIYFAVTRNRYGETEPRYAELMSPTIYRHKRSVDGYGVKFWCNCKADKDDFIGIIART